MENLMKNNNDLDSDRDSDRDRDRDSDSDGLDISWMKEQARMNSLEHTQKREPMQTIHLSFIYINKRNSIDKICHGIEVLEHARISGERLLNIIQHNKIRTLTSKFKLWETLLYNIDLEPELIQHADFTSSYLKPVSIIHDIKIPDSVFIFHNVNKLYFIFKEVEVKSTNPNKTQSLKSILKPVSIVGPGSRLVGHTKKVRIAVAANQTTRKNTN